MVQKEFGAEMQFEPLSNLGESLKFLDLLPLCENFDDIFDILIISEQQKSLVSELKSERKVDVFEVPYVKTVSVLPRAPTQSLILLP